MKQALRAALAARKPTFLAFLPRWIKLVVAGLLLLLMLYPLAMVDHSPDPEAAQPLAEHAQSEKEPSAHGVVPPLATEPDAPLPPADLPASPPEPSAQPAPAPAVPPVSLGNLSDVQRAAIAANDELSRSVPLPTAPDPALIEQFGDTILPKISTDGRSPWRVYARPFDERDPRPRLALVMVDMGLSRVATDAALRRLPPNVTLAFDTQSDGVRDWLQRARSDGHETLLSLPMEPLDYPRSDPGPNTLLTTLPNGDNLSRFFVSLRAGSGYVGVTSLTASRFGTDAAKVQAMMSEVRARGLLVLDTRVGSHTMLKDMADKMGVPFAVSARSIDDDPSPYAIDQALADIERRVVSEGKVVALVSPLPSSLDRLEVWLKKLSAKGIALAPLSAVVQ